MNILVKKIVILLLIFNSTNTLYANKDQVDLIVFSYNRPLQLYAFLESVEKYLSGIGNISVIYKTSNDSYENGYKTIKKKFSNAIFFKQQSILNNSDFKTLFLETINKSKTDYIVFAVDDIIIKDYIDLQSCVKYLQITNSYGFYLRLGKNIIQCYMHNDESTPVPFSNHIHSDIYQWNFKDGKGDWQYPNTVDMTVYKKSDIATNLLKINFDNPSNLEAYWAQHADLNLNGLYFEESKIINIPLNKVHEESLNIDNRVSNYFTTEELLKIFNQGYKINIDKFYKIKNLAPHANLIPEFIKI